MVTTTSTGPTTCAGTVALIVTASTTCTFVAATPPMVIDVGSALVKPPPLMSIVVPPAGSADEGVTSVMLSGGCVYWNALASVPLRLFGFLTTTSILTAASSLAGPSGVNAVMVVAATTVTFIAARAPIVTVAPP